MAKSISMCSGCYNNIYRPCWNYKTARIVTKIRVHINDMPPYAQEPEKYLSCYRVPQYAFLTQTARDKAARKEKLKAIQAAQRKARQDAAQ